jgi:ABC-type branched-subunit amino acid transport system substrate-binding protein
MEQTGARRFYMPSADYIWPHTMNKKAREVVAARRGEIVGEEYFPLDHVDYERIVADIVATGAEVVFNTIVPPGLTSFLERLHRAGFTARGGHTVCTYLDENFLNLVPVDQVEGLYECLDRYRAVDDPFSIELLNRYERLYPRNAMFTAGSACTATYRALKLWEIGVNEAGSLNQEDIIGPLDHARIAPGPGGPAEMVQSAPRSDEHLHRPIRGRHVQGGEEPGSHRPEGMRGRTRLRSAPGGSTRKLCEPLGRWRSWPVPSPRWWPGDPFSGRSAKHRPAGWWPHWPASNDRPIGAGAVQRVRGQG